VTSQKILAPHTAKTLSRCREQSRVLALNDTTEVDFTSHPKVKGAGYLHTHTTGFLMHSVLTASTTGVPLGVLSAEMWTRRHEDFGKAKDRKEKTVAEKESSRWLRAVEAASRIAADGSATEVISIGDRENDIYEVFAAERARQVHLLIRLGQNRRILAPSLSAGSQANGASDNSSEADSLTKTRIKEYAAALPLTGMMEVRIGHSNSQEERVVSVGVAYSTITILPPGKTKGGVTVQLVVAREIIAPIAEASHLSPEQEDREPIEWILLTTLPIESLEDAMTMVRYYALRWLIERFHYTLKSGCGIEKLQLETVQRLQNAVATYLLIAWRLLWLTYTARTQPQSSCEIVLEAHEWQALHAVVCTGEDMPTQAPTLQQAVLWIARLGGFLARKRDGFPGVKVLWLGWSRLTDIVRTWLIAKEHFSPS